MGLFSRAKEAFSGSEGENDIWQQIEDPSTIETILEESNNKPQLIYKHSHRCSVCFVAQGNLESAAEEILQEAEMHFVNVVKSRNISDAIAEQLDLRHESPQAILLKNGEVVWHASHGKIDADAILEKVA